MSRCCTRLIRGSPYSFARGVRAAAAAFGAGVILLLLAASPSATPPSTAPATVQRSGSGAPVLVYENRFEHRPGGEWSKRDTDATPRGRRPFLGMFGGEQVSLSLADLPPHKFLRLSFSLFMINPVDGSNPVFGPDVWDLTVAGGPSLLHTTFDNCGFFSDNNEQAFPDEFPEAPGKPWPGWTGCDEKQTLGYLHSWGGPERTFGVDSVYHFNFPFPHDQKSLKLLFTSYSIEDKDGEAWGIGSIRVDALPEAPASPESAELRRRWDDLRGPEPVRAFHAKWGLIAAGDAGRAFLVEQLKCPVDPKRLRELVLALSDDRPTVRDQATADLIALGSRAVPALSKALETEEAPEAQVRLQQVLTTLDEGSANDPEALRRKRAMHALRILNREPAHFTPRENGWKPKPGEKDDG